MRDLKSLALAAAAFLLIAGGIVAQVFAADATLRPELTVEGEAVRLDQLFEGVTTGGAAIVATAPRPGKSITLDAATLTRIANRHGLAWQPQDFDVSATITRAARQIDGAEIEALVAEALAERLLSSEFEIELSGEWPGLRVAVEADEAPVLVDLKHDSRSGRFVAQIAAARGLPSDEQLKIAGRVVRTESIPVPARAIGVGEVIGEADLEWRRFPADRLGQDPVVGAEGILGKAPRRALKPGLPVRAGDLVVPLIVQKGAPVTMVYTAPGITLTMVGRALDGGADGQWIRVLNPQSKVIAYGAVTPDGTVIVSTGTPAERVALDSHDGEIW